MTTKQSPEQSSSDPLDKLVDDLWGRALDMTSDDFKDDASYLTAQTNYRNLSKKAITDYHLQKCRSYLPDEITAGDIENGILSNYSRHDNADTQKGFNKCLDQITKRIEED